MRISMLRTFLILGLQSGSEAPILIPDSSTHQVRQGTMAATETVYMRVSPELKAALKDEAVKEDTTQVDLGREFWIQALKLRGYSFDSGSPAPASPPGAA